MIQPRLSDVEHSRLVSPPQHVPARHSHWFFRGLLGTIYGLHNDFCGGQYDFDALQNHLYMLQCSVYGLQCDFFGMQCVLYGMRRQSNL